MIISIFSDMFDFYFRGNSCPDPALDSWLWVSGCCFRIGHPTRSEQSEAALNWAWQLLCSPVRGTSTPSSEKVPNTPEMQHPTPHAGLWAPQPRRADMTTAQTFTGPCLKWPLGGHSRVLQTDFPPSLMKMLLHSWLRQQQELKKIFPDRRQELLPSLS